VRPLRKLSQRGPVCGRAVSADLPDVIETDGLISFWKGKEGVQGCMFRAGPRAVVLRSKRTMMGFALMRDDGSHIGMIGPGGGSFVKYRYRYFPRSITAVEINPQVIALRDRFSIPPDDERLSVICADGARLMLITSQSFDTLLLDGFHSEGATGVLTRKRLYKACHGRLADAEGLVSIFLADDCHLGRDLAGLSQLFRSSVIIVFAESNPSSLVAFAWKGNASIPLLRTLARRVALPVGDGRIDRLDAAGRISKAWQRSPATLNLSSCSCNTSSVALRQIATP
jgi:spermidine synthase